MPEGRDVRLWQRENYEVWTPEALHSCPAPTPDIMQTLTTSTLHTMNDYGCPYDSDHRPLCFAPHMHRLFFVL